ncbi:hypothetical protein KDA_24080 [Dictyobacter alpinus]|uniref:Uncharacterized protein n=1 Tax=Dictyobacter alpinus TaxID=2014873 RepID=A0A402B6E9_9CHLR|nr:DUF6585 family protein [Dictyobacter alpinus]GCE26924.1 hypothetical protein KDA_24080 [Dictyobacter alpinus]
MSDDVMTEGERLGKQHKLDQLVVTLKVDYRSSDLFYALYLSIVTPCILVLLAIGFIFSMSFQLTTTTYYALVSVIAFLYLSILSVSWLRDYRPLLPPYRKNMHVHIYKEGFVRVTNQRTDVVRWDDMQRVRYKRSTSMGGDDYNSVVKIWRNGGRKLVFNSTLKNVDLLGRLAEREYQSRHVHTPTIATNNIEFL